MVERAAVLSVEREVTPVNGRLILRPEQIPLNEQDLRRRLSGSLVELPIYASMLVTDGIRGGLSYLRYCRDSHRWLNELPRGHKEPVVLETGYMGPEWSLKPMKDRFLRIGYRSKIARLQAKVNRELIEKRAEIVAETFDDVDSGSDETVYGVGWSKGTLDVLAAAHLYPEVFSRGAHFALLGIPLEVNPALGRIYLGTQAINKLVSGRTDVALMRKLNLAGGMRIPEGIKITVVESENNGISTFRNDGYPEVHYVRCAHTAFGFDQEVFRIMAWKFAGYELAQVKTADGLTTYAPYSLK